MNIIKKLGLIVLVLAVAVGVASAQQGPGPHGPGRGGSGSANGIRLQYHSSVLEVIAQETGLTRLQILAEVQGGATLAEIIEANGGSVQVVIDAAVTAVTERVNAAVESGRLTQEQADLLLADLESRIMDMLNGDFTCSPVRSRSGRV